MTRFISIGEAMVELAPLAKEGQFQMSFAGDTLNTAWYARQLKPMWEIGYVTAIGDDQMSDQLVKFLGDSGILADQIQRSKDRTIGLYLISLENGERHFSYWRGQAAARGLAADASALDRAFATADVLYFSGITLAILEGNGRARLLRSLARARTGGRKIVFDSNLRPKLWESTDHMRDWVSKAAAVSDIILPSHDDEAVHFGDANPRATLDRYANLGAKTVVVKNGPGTIHYLHGSASGVVQPAVVSDVVDTTAAGDSFNAGFLTQFTDRGDIAAAIRTASNVARRVIKGRGALVAL